MQDSNFTFSNSPTLSLNLNTSLIENVFEFAKKERSPVFAVVVGTKPDFYKQAPLVKAAVADGIPTFVIATGQHYDNNLGFGVKEFGIDELVAADLQIRGDLMEKASQLILRFGSFGRVCKQEYPNTPIFPIVHGDTLVAGIAPLAWVFGVGQKVGQNEAGLRSMAPLSIRELRPNSEPTAYEIERFADSQFNGKWFLAREEPFPEQIDTWICSAGTRLFFAPTALNKENLVREGYPEEDINVVGNTVVDAIEIKRAERPSKSIFEIYPKLESGEWIRIDIHRRENLTKSRFSSIIGGITDLVKSGHKVVFIKLTATQKAIDVYGLGEYLRNLEEQYPQNFIQTPLWKEYANVIEFLDSKRCWCELTDSGSMQEELLYFPDVLSLTVRLNTDRPETVFDARGNILVPPLNSHWIRELVVAARERELGAELKRNKKQIYGRPGEVSNKIASIIKQYFEQNDNSYPWLHQRLGLWKEKEELGYL